MSAESRLETFSQPSEPTLHLDSDKNSEANSFTVHMCVVTIYLYRKHEHD